MPHPPTTPIQSWWRPKQKHPTFPYQKNNTDGLCTVKLVQVKR